MPRRPDAEARIAGAREQMTTRALALRRAQAPLAATQAERKELADRAATRREGLARRTDLEARAEQVGIDLTVTKQVLIEVQGKLERLEPVRYELLQRR
jgi:hypothetical protein